MMVKLTIKLMVRDPNTKRLKECQSEALMENFSLETLRQLWSIERAINDYTPMRCHISLNEVPDGLTPTPRIEK